MKMKEKKEEKSFFSSSLSLSLLEAPGCIAISRKGEEEKLRVKIKATNFRESKYQRMKLKTIEL